MAATIERAIPAKAIDEKLARSPSMGGMIIFGLILAAGLFYLAQHLASDLSVEQFPTYRTEIARAGRGLTRKVGRQPSKFRPTIRTLAPRT